MFTGIIQSLPVQKVRWRKKGIEICVKRPENFSSLKPGGSVALNGICLSAEKVLASSLVFYMGHETLRLVAQKKPEDFKGRKVHLELPLRLSDPLGGHLVTGHVHGLAQITKTKKQGACLLWELCFPPPWHTYLREKSFIALNGVSLTLNHVVPEKRSASVCLVPETLKRTHFKDFKKGACLNFETDYLALLINPPGKTKQMKKPLSFGR